MGFSGYHLLSVFSTPTCRHSSSTFKMISIKQKYAPGPLSYRFWSKLDKTFLLFIYVFFHFLKTWYNPGITWYHPGITLVPPWNHPGTTLESSWYHPGITWYHPGTTLESLWYHIPPRVSQQLEYASQKNDSDRTVKRTHPATLLL